MIKNFKDLSWDVTEEEYRADPAISYSTLSTYAREGVSGLKSIIVDKRVLDTPSIRYGSLVDTLLTEPDRFEDLFAIVSFNMPSTTIKNIIDEVFLVIVDQNEAINLEDYCLDNKDSVLDIINANGYGGDNWKPETKIRKVVEEGLEYFNSLHTSRDKIIISEEDYRDALTSIAEIKNNRFTSFLFEENESAELFYQLKFKIPCVVDPTKEIRCMFDLIYVNHKDKVIIPIDLKTTYDEENRFGEKSFYNWYYDLQSTMYTYILKTTVLKDPFFSEYEVQPFRFLPINRKFISPQFYVHNQSTSANQRTFTDSFGNKHKPWYLYLKEVRYHIDTDQYRYKKEVIENDGKNYIDTWN